MNNQISRRALIKFWAYNICELRITAKVYCRFRFEYWTLLKVINPHCLVQVPTVKYRFLIISCVQTIFPSFQGWSVIGSFPLFSVYFPCADLYLFVIRMRSSLVTRLFDFSQLWRYPVPGPGLPLLTSPCVSSYTQRSCVAASITLFQAGRRRRVWP